MPNLYVLRHGQTEYNLQKIMQGSVNTNLNNTGISQAKESSYLFRNLSIDILISSPLARAIQTTNIIKSELKLSHNIIINNNFTEFSYGVFNGKSYSEIKKTHPFLFQSSEFNYHYKIPDSISLFDFEKKISKAISNLKKQYPNKNILLVTHGVTACMIHKFFHNIPASNFFEHLPANCTFNTYTL